MRAPTPISITGLAAVSFAGAAKPARVVCRVRPFRSGSSAVTTTMPRPAAGRLRADQAANVTATNGEMSTLERARDHSQASPSGRRAAPATASSSTPWERWASRPAPSASTNAPQARAWSEAPTGTTATRARVSSATIDAATSESATTLAPRYRVRAARTAAATHATPGRWSTTSTTVRWPHGPATASAAHDRSADTSTAIAVTGSGRMSGWAAARQAARSRPAAATMSDGRGHTLRYARSKAASSWRRTHSCSSTETGKARPAVGWARTQMSGSAGS